LQTLAKGPLRQTHALGRPSWDLILQIAQRQPLYFAHVFSHVGTEGNDLADIAADAASNNLRLPEYPASPLDVARVCRRAEVEVLKREKTIPTVQAHAKMLNMYAPRIQNTERSFVPWTPSFRTMKTQVIIHRLLCGVDFWLGGWSVIDDRNLQICPACKQHVSRSTTNASEHPTVHFFMFCRDKDIKKLISEKLGHAPTPALLWSDSDKVIDYFIARRKLLKGRELDNADQNE